MSLSLAAVAPPHAAAVARIHAASFPCRERWSEAAFTTLLADPTVFGFVAEAGGTALFRAVAGEGEVLTIGVVPEARRQGIASALLRAGLDEGRRRGAGAIFLEVAATDAGARSLYLAAGFVAVGRRTGYYGVGRDALLMRALLGASGPGPW